MILNNENGQVFLRNQWFYYWETSASLWESQLREHVFGDEVWIPLNWGLHYLGDGKFDFGQERPELNMARLITLCRQLSKKPIVFIPIGPNPLFPLGGLHPQLARHETLDSSSVARAVLLPNSSINKIASQYETQVFQVYRKFLWNFVQNLNENKASVACRGLLAFSFFENEFLSWWNDSSPAFENAYQRSLKKQDNLEKNHFQNLMVDLFVEAGIEVLSDLWEGITPICYLGSSPHEFFERVSHWPITSNFFRTVQRSMEKCCVPDVSLYNSKELTSEKQYFFDKWLDHFYLDDLIQPIENQEHLLPMVLVDLYENTEFKICSFQNAKNLGLYSFLTEEYAGLFRGKSIKDLDAMEEIGIEPRLKCLLTDKIETEDFQKILKLFMVGHTILVNKSSIKTEDLRRLEIFILENKLNKEVINFVSMIEVISLSDGKIILFDGDILKAQEIKKQNTFWKSLFNTMKWKLLHVQKDEQVLTFWKTSNQSQTDFNYIEKRRLTLVNTSEEIQVVQVPFDKRFAFLKMVDPNEAQITSTPLGLEVKLAAQGIISLDYGQYEE